MGLANARPFFLHYPTPCVEKRAIWQGKGQKNRRVCKSKLAFLLQCENLRHVCQTLLVCAQSRAVFATTGWGFWRNALLLGGNFASGWVDGVVYNHFANAVGNDASANGVFYRKNVAVYRCLDGAVFEGKVGIHHDAIHQFEVLAVAKGLCANNCAIVESDVLAVPSKVLALDNAMLHQHVFRMPQGILGVQGAMADGCVFYVLEGILATHFHIAKFNVLGAKQKVLATCRAVGKAQIASFPTKLITLDATVGNGNVVALSHGFDAVKLAVLNVHLRAVPKWRTASFRLRAMGNLHTVAMPQWVAQLKVAVLHNNVSAFLQSRFAIFLPTKTAVLHRCILQVVQGTFLPKSLVGNCVLHVASCCTTAPKKRTTGASFCTNVAILPHLAMHGEQSKRQLFFEKMGKEFPCPQSC